MLINEDFDPKDIISRSDGDEDRPKYSKPPPPSPHAITKTTDNSSYGELPDPPSSDPALLESKIITSRAFQKADQLSSPQTKEKQFTPHAQRIRLP